MQKRSARSAVDLEFPPLTTTEIGKFERYCRANDYTPPLSSLTMLRMLSEIKAVRKHLGVQVTLADLESVVKAAEVNEELLKMHRGAADD